MKLLDKSSYQWLTNSSGFKYCHITDLDKSLNYYTGVSKIINYGEQTLKDKLVAQHGLATGTQMANKIYNIGTKAHSQIEDNKQLYLSSELQATLGDHLADEVLVYSDNLLGNRVIGFIDSVYQAPDGSLTLIDYKTKASRSSFIKYNQSATINKAYLQLVAYSALFKLTYGTDIKAVKAIFIYLNGCHEPDVYELPATQFFAFGKQFSEKLKMYSRKHQP